MVAELFIVNVETRYSRLNEDILVMKRTRVSRLYDERNQKKNFPGDILLINYTCY